MSAIIYISVISADKAFQVLQLKHQPQKSNIDRAPYEHNFIQKFLHCVINIHLTLLSFIHPPLSQAKKFMFTCLNIVSCLSSSTALHSDPDVDGRPAL